jgi:hypothetical protein
MNADKSVFDSNEKRYSYQPGNLFLGGLLRMVQDVSLRLFWRCLLDVGVKDRRSTATSLHSFLERSSMLALI